MFTTNHYIWLAICAVLIGGGLLLLNKHKPSLRSVLNLACVGAVLSELIKVFSSIRLIPTADGSMMFPYLELEHLPFHLCSLQIILIFYVRFAKPSKFRDMVLAFMYPSCAIGAAFALALPSIFPSSIDISQAFTHPLAYQYFLYHVMLILLGAYILMSDQVDLRPKHYWTTVGMLGVMAFISFYLNSMFATPVYQNGKVVYVENTTNFLFTYEPPIDVVFTELWHWFVYVAVIAALALLLIAVYYIPIFRRARKKTAQPS